MARQQFRQRIKRKIPGSRARPRLTQPHGGGGSGAGTQRAPACAPARHLTTSRLHSLHITIRGLPPWFPQSRACGLPYVRQRTDTYCGSFTVPAILGPAAMWEATPMPTALAPRVRYCVFSCSIAGRVRPPHIAGRTHIAGNVARDFDAKFSFGQRAADAVASFGGSWTFVGLLGATILLTVPTASALRLCANARTHYSLKGRLRPHPYVRQRTDRP
jgi:hypothetical protein